MFSPQRPAHDITDGLLRGVHGLTARVREPGDGMADRGVSERKVADLHKQVDTSLPVLPVKPVVPRVRVGDIALSLILRDEKCSHGIQNIEELSARV